MISYNAKVVLLVQALVLMSSTVAQVANCSTSSPQCCWVVRIWQLMGQTTSVSPTNPTGCCLSTWGVTCSGSSVLEILWFQRGLHGNIPSDIGNLKSLTKLSLGNSLFLLSSSTANRLTGPIPSQIGDLLNLRTLDLNANQLNGSIPSTIGNLRNLQELHIARNQLSGSIPSTIGNLNNLRTLLLYTNQLSGSIPSTIGNLKNLESLHLLGNQFSGSIPLTIGNMASLQYLVVRWNRLSGSIPAAIGSLKNLKYMDNQISGSIPSTIANLTNLDTLDLANNRLSGAIPLAIGNLRNLTYLYLSNNIALNGRFTPLCSIVIDSVNTSMTLCGCSSSISPAFIFPPQSTPVECLSTGPASPLTKRILTFSHNIGALKFTCYRDLNSNPFQDCLNAIAAICNTAYIGSNPARISTCKTAVDVITFGLNTHWQKVRKECGQWAFNGFRGNFSSSECLKANSILQESTYYILPDGTRSYVTSQLTESVRLALWNNPTLRG